MALNNFKDLTGKRFGRLVVLSRAPTENNATRWNCLCDCGNDTVARGGNLHTGTTQSCGCISSEKSRERWSSKGQWHAGSNHPLAPRWRSMLGRCYDVEHRQYKDYGGRGIGVCERWHIFQNFLEDLGEVPGVGYSLDRIDNDGHYEPRNCRWATQKQQTQNRRPSSEWNFKKKKEIQDLFTMSEQLKAENDRLKSLTKALKLEVKGLKKQLALYMGTQGPSPKP